MKSFVIASVLIATTANLSAQEKGPDKNAWVAEMKKVHGKFDGEPGTFYQFGDSISESRASWSSMRWHENKATTEMKPAFSLVKGHMRQACWDRKGGQYGNRSRMTIRWADENIDNWLKTLNPEAVSLMFGTNDLNALGAEEYETKLRGVISKCLDNGAVVILNTIPPRHGKAEKAAEFADVARRVARELKVPLIDYQAEILKRRPTDWDGALDKFSDYTGYDVPTLIARDGVHPSNSKKHSGDFSAVGLKNNGFGLLNYLLLMKYAEVIDEVLK
jgi:hypothetical protein